MTEKYKNNPLAGVHICRVLHLYNLHFTTLINFRESTGRNILFDEKTTLAVGGVAVAVTALLLEFIANTKLKPLPVNKNILILTNNPKNH